MVTHRDACIWAAGLFEGEGCIAITRSKRPKNKVWHQLVCTVQMGDHEPLERLQKSWGGTIVRMSVTGNRRPQESWRISSRQAVVFLLDIRPFVSAYRILAKLDLAVEFQAQKRNTGQSPPPEYLAAQADYHERMRVLNQRGLASVFGRALPRLPDTRYDTPETRGNARKRAQGGAQ